MKQNNRFRGHLATGDRLNGISARLSEQVPSFLELGDSLQHHEGVGIPLRGSRNLSGNVGIADDEVPDGQPIQSRVLAAVARMLTKFGAAR
jgi:hypothetical protein